MLLTETKPPTRWLYVLSCLSLCSVDSVLFLARWTVEEGERGLSGLVSQAAHPGNTLVIAQLVECSCWTALSRCLNADVSANNTPRPNEITYLDRKA